MGGLGCGSVAGGYLADRLPQRQRLVLFAIAELAIALFAFVSLPLYYGVLHTHFGDMARSPVLLPVVLFGSLLWPTFFMGMSLPLLARAMTPHVHGAAKLVGTLYAVNTLGGAVGAMVTAWWFMRHLGFEQTIRLGALLNLCVAVGAAVLVHATRTEALAEPAETSAPVAAAAPAPRMDEPQRRRSDLVLWMATYALAGLLALSLEIVWFRLLGVMLKATSFTFGHLLALYLTGLTAGTFAGQWLVERVKRPAAVFLALQAAVSLYAGLGLIGVTTLAPELTPLWEYFGRYDPLAWSEARDRPGLVFALFVLLPAVLMGPPTLMMGLSFPFLQRVVQRDLATLGRRVGWLQGANIIGSMFGAALTGWAALRVLGTSVTLSLLVALGVVFLLLLLHGSRGQGLNRWSRLAVGAAIALIILVASQIPRAATLWATLHGTTAARTIHSEDDSGLSLLKGNSVHMHGETVVYANGLGQSSVPFPAHHITLGLMPLMMHPHPQEIAIVGLGSGRRCMRPVAARRPVAFISSRSWRRSCTRCGSCTRVPAMSDSGRCSTIRASPSHSPTRAGSFASGGVPTTSSRPTPCARRVRMPGTSTRSSTSSCSDGTCVRAVSPSRGRRPSGRSRRLPASFLMACGMSTTTSRS